MYELSNKSGATNATFANHTSNLYKIFKAHNLLNLPANEKDLTIEDIKGIIQEIQQNILEVRYTQDSFTADELARMTEFMRDYYYVFLQGNDTVTQLSVSDLYSHFIFTLEERARQVLGDPSAQPWSDIYKTQKYTYLQLHDQALVAFLKGMQVSNWVPEPTSSLVVEFYQIAKNAKFQRADFGVKFLLDDNLLTLSNIGITCVDTLCPWDKVAAYLESRVFNGNLEWGGMTKQQLCFSHLNIVVPDDKKTEGVPWWLAIVISIPLAIITLAVIKIAQVMIAKNEKAAHDKRKHRAEAH